MSYKCNGDGDMSYDCNGDGDIYDDDGEYDEEYEEEAVENLEEWDDEDVDGPVYGRETAATADSKLKQDEDEPRRYYSAFILYTNAVRDEVKAKHPEVDFGTFVQVCDCGYIK
jgi:hypothetical protein